MIKDYELKLGLVSEQENKLLANKGKILTEESLNYLEALVNESIYRRNAAVESGRKYKKVLLENANSSNREWSRSQIDLIEDNEKKLINGKEKDLNYYKESRLQYKINKSKSISGFDLIYSILVLTIVVRYKKYIKTGEN